METGQARRCQGKTKAGKPCRAAATKGGLCFFHANPKKAAELGRIGGRSRGAARTQESDPLPPLDTAIGVRDTISQVIANILSGKVDPSVGSGIAPLLNLQLRSIDRTDLDRRLRLLEEEKREAAELPDGGDLDPVRTSPLNKNGRTKT